MLFEVNIWSIGLLDELRSASGAGELFDRVSRGACELGFEYCAYGVCRATPFTNPRVAMLSNYDPRWKARYDTAGYMAVDPTVRHARRSHEPLVWSDALFASAPELWGEAQSFGLRVGWAQSCFDADGSVGLLSLSRSREALTDVEILAKEPLLRWFVNIAHTALSGILLRLPGSHEPLSRRELEVLKWTADGKTSVEMAAILGISHDTVNFHVKNATRKLGATGRSAGVARAAALGLLR
jgi:DNA-binding CsgD family transcriptional regulator